MHENRTVYPKRKTQMYQQLQELPKKYKVLALVRMEKVRASQLLPLRKTLQGEVEIISVKDKLAKLALEKTGIKGIEKLVSKLEGQCLFMFTNMSPFKLNVLLSKNKVLLNARGGDLASMDVIIPPKNTGIAPGPMLTDFKENGVPTKIDQGTIWIMKETIPVKKVPDEKKKVVIEKSSTQVFGQWKESGWKNVYSPVTKGCMVAKLIPTTVVVINGQRVAAYKELCKVR